VQAQAPGKAPDGGAADWRADYGYILSKYVKASGFDYASLNKNKADIDKLISVTKALEHHTPEYIQQYSRDEQFAIYVNAYNAWMLVKALELYPIDSILNKYPNFYKEAKIIVGNELTFDVLEHEILRKQYFDARVHFAVNCASKGCPPLLNEPYAGHKLEEQLNLATTNFLNSEHGIKLKSAQSSIAEASQLFEWFASDFIKQEGSVVNFINKYTDHPIKTVSGYLDYDWSLNQSS